MLDSRSGKELAHNIEVVCVQGVPRAVNICRQIDTLDQTSLHCFAAKHGDVMIADGGWPLK